MVVSTSAQVVKIFWPSDLLDTGDSALILGWRNSMTDLFVIDLVSNIYRDGLEAPLDIGSLVTKYPISRVTQFCGDQPLSILGQLSKSINVLSGADYVLQCYIEHDSIFPQFHPRADGAAIQLIIFDRPDPHRMQYFALQPVPFEQIAHRESREKSIGDELIFQPCKSTHDHSLTQLHINQMNCAQEVAVVLQKKLPQLGSRRNRNRAQSFHETVSGSAYETINHLYAHIVDAFQRTDQELRPYIQRSMSTLIWMELRAIDSISYCLSTRISGPDIALTDISVTARELEFRIQKLKSWPSEYRVLRHRKKDWASITSYHPDYIKFYNGMWLIANDLIFGLYLVSFCLNNEAALAESIYGLVSEYSIGSISEMMLWLKGYPAGLKLNSELASFLGDLFLWLIASWKDCLQMLHPYLPLIVRTIGLGGFLGASLSISLVSDVLSLLTLHLHVFYVVSARLYDWQLTILISLFHLFRGRKHNVLRERIDSCDYDLDQLLLGTILFTLLAFLFPTVLVFYLTFAASRIALKFIKTGLDMILAFLVQFPLFALLLRIKDSKRLPGGIRFTLLPPQEHTRTIVNSSSGASAQATCDNGPQYFGSGKNRAEASPRVSYLYIESKPLSFDLMFQSLVTRQSNIMGSTLNITTLLREIFIGKL